MATVTIGWNDLPYQKSFTIKQGDGIEYPVHLKIKAEAATTYSDLDLTGATLKLYVKKGDTVLVNGTSITPDTILQGKLTVRIAGATTATWTEEQVYELELTLPNGHTNFPSGTVKTVIEGRIRVRTDIG